MGTRVARGPAGKARKTARKDTVTMKRRLEAIGKALDKAGRDFVARIKEMQEIVRAAFARIGKSAQKTATTIEDEIRDDVKAVRERLAGKEAPPVRKPAAKKVVKKPAAAKKAAQRKAPARRRTTAKKATAKKAPARRTTAGKKAAPKPKAA
jgi:hypothetical protein